MKRKNLFPLFLMALIIWGMSACTSTGPLTKCPDMKPVQEKQTAFKFKKKKENPRVVSQKYARNDGRDGRDGRDVRSYVSTDAVTDVPMNVSTDVPMNVSTDVPTNKPTQSPILLKQKQLLEIDNNLMPKTLANTPQNIPVSAYDLSIDQSIYLEQQMVQTAVTATNTSTTKQIIKAKKKALRQAIKAKKNVVRQAIKQRRSKRASTFTNHLGMSEAGLILILLAIFIPPLAMFIYDEGFSNRFWISLILTCIAILPGSIYTLVVILSD